MDLLLCADRVLLDGAVRPASVAVADGRIAAIGERDAEYECGTVVDLPPTAVLLPGFVDTHVHVNEPGTDWEGFASATAAAATAGITTLVDMPLDSDPVTTTVDALTAKRRIAEREAIVDIGYWAGAVPGNLGALAPLAAAGVAGFKCFLVESGNPNFGHLTPEQFRSAAAEVAALDSVLLVHAESHDVIATSPPPRGTAYASFLASRPAAAEVDAVALVLATARETGARVHVVHVSAADVLGRIADARRSGLRVSAETCPHYLTFDAETVPDGGTAFAACPPIRARANRDPLWAGLLDGTLDMVVSDHSPCAPEFKGGGDFAHAFGGVSSLELGPRVVWTHAERRGFGLAELSTWMSQRPAALAGYHDRGTIAVGMRADLCAFDPDASATVRAIELRHRHDVSPYDGMTLRGRALRTWVAGRSVYDDAGVAA